MHVYLDKSRCSGVGLCESIAPDHFEVADDGSLTILRERIDTADVELIEQAVSSCPTLALSLTE
jgi:ferredoxin